MSGHLPCTVTVSMSRHISTLHFLQSADTCLTWTRTVIYWLFVPAITDSVNKCCVFDGHVNPKSLAHTLTFESHNQYFMCCRLVKMLGAICGSEISMDLAAQSMDPYSAQKSMDCAEICGSRRVQSTDLPVLYPDLTLISLL